MFVNLKINYFNKKNICLGIMIVALFVEKEL